jgi:3',5'-cyclic AMP phosphodiesterase CpdA
MMQAVRVVVALNIIDSVAMASSASNKILFHHHFLPLQENLRNLSRLVNPRDLYVDMRPAQNVQMCWGIQTS